jgi:hypothetical protein
MLSLALVELTRYRRYHAEQKPCLYYVRRCYVAPTEWHRMKYALCPYGGGAGYRPRVRSVYATWRLSP